MLSFTFDYSLYKNLPSWSDVIDWSFVPYARFYTQSSSDFYYDTNARTPVAINGDTTSAQSTDYRLSSFGAATVGVKLAAQYNNFSGNIGFDYYNQEGDWSWFDGVENPALVDYLIFSIGFSAAF